MWTHLDEHSDLNLPVQALTMAFSGEIRRYSVAARTCPSWIVPAVHCIFALLHDAGSPHWVLYDEEVPLQGGIWR